MEIVEVSRLGLEPNTLKYHFPIYFRLLIAIEQSCLSLRFRLGPVKIFPLIMEFLFDTVYYFLGLKHK